MKNSHKHAYLIIAHNEFELLEYLVKSIDDPRNDIFIHIDRKSNFKNTRKIEDLVLKSNTYIYSKFSVTWGDETQVKCEMFLLEKAHDIYKYDYYHIISGVDFPIKTQDYIHEFFLKNSGKEFVHFDSFNINSEVYDRVNYYHLLSKYYKRSKNKLFNFLIFKLDNLLVLVQKMLKIKKNIGFNLIQKGCNWCSITNNLTEYILHNKDNIKQLVYKSRCADEVFIQTVIINSKFKDNLFNTHFDNDYHSCIRLILWDEKNVKSPKKFEIDDYNMLKSSKEIFARKFTCNTQKGKALVKKIYNEIKGEVL